MDTLFTVTMGYDLSLLDRLAASIDYPIKWKVVVGNGCDLGNWIKHHPGWYSLGNPKVNLGCAGGWNLASALDFEAAIISNDDEVFQPGALEVICKEVDQHLDAPIIHINEHEAYDVFVWTRTGIEKFGLFDENFWPIYFEDYEYRCRLKAGGGVPYHINKGLPVKHGKPKVGGPGYMKMLELCKPINEGYLLDKWGVIEYPPKYSTPFNKWGSIKEWTLDKARREKLVAIRDAHWRGSVYL